jgi:hypothetical protein
MANPTYARIPGISRDCALSGPALFGVSIDASRFTPAEFEAAMPTVMQMLQEEFALARAIVEARIERALSSNVEAVWTNKHGMEEDQNA